MRTLLRQFPSLSSFLLAAILLLPGGNVLAQSAPPRIERLEVPHNGAPITLQLDAIEMGQLVTMLLRDVMRVPYVISPEVIRDRRPTSVNIVISRKNTAVEVVRFLRAIGYEVRLVGGSVHVSTGDLKPSPSTVQAFHRSQAAAGNTYEPASAVPSGSPLGSVAGNNVARSPQQMETVPLSPDRPSVIDQGEELVAILTPAFRAPGELAGVLEAAFPSLRIAYRETTEPRGMAIAGSLSPDTLTIAGAEAMTRRAIAVARELDKPRPLVKLQGLFIEVRETQERGSALSVLANLLGDTLSIGSLTGEPSSDNFLGLNVGGLKAVLSAVRGDGRFRVVAEPSITAMSGTTATLNAGAQVPTLGSVSFSEDGTPIRSVVYRDSGLTLRVAPHVRTGLVELSIEQERSSFASTNTGVNDSPTLNRSTASTQVTLAPGEMVALAGLQERTESESRRGLFGGLLGSKTRQKGASELLVLLEAQVVQPDASATMTVAEFPILKPEGDKSDAAAS